MHRFEDPKNILYSVFKKLVFKDNKRKITNYYVDDMYLDLSIDVKTDPYIRYYNELINAGIDKNIAVIKALMLKKKIKFYKEEKNIIRVYFSDNTCVVINKKSNSIKYNTSEILECIKCNYECYLREFLDKFYEKGTDKLIVIKSDSNTFYKNKNSTENTILVDKRNPNICSDIIIDFVNSTNKYIDCYINTDGKYYVNQDNMYVVNKILLTTLDRSKKINFVNLGEDLYTRNILSSINTYVKRHNQELENDKVIKIGEIK